MGNSSQTSDEKAQFKLHCECGSVNTELDDECPKCGAPRLSEEFVRSANELAEALDKALGGEN